GKTLKPDSSVELFYLHAPDHQNPIQDALQACHELHDELGLPNYTASEVAEIVTICKQLDTSHCLSGNTQEACIYTIKHYLWMIHVFYVRYWKECHFQDIELVQKALETVYGSDKQQTMTSAAPTSSGLDGTMILYTMTACVIIEMSSIEQLQRNPFASEGPPDERVVEAFQQV
uniref:Aldo-keto reductase family 7, member A3 (aflatoxin aldehyde reductase) n=1 Tax=Salmo trutta TaxID=8032 RepID=A0A673XMI6_SALTR